MKTVGVGGSNVETLLFGESIAVTCENCTGKIETSKAPPYQEGYTVEAFLIDNATIIGPFPDTRLVRLSSGRGTLQYLKGVDPKIVVRKDSNLGIGVIEPIEDVEALNTIKAGLFDGPGGGASLPIDLSDSPGSVVNVLGLANGGSGGISNGRVPFGSGGVLATSSSLQYTISGDFGVGGTPFRRMESITDASNDGIRIRTTVSNHNALMEIDAHGSAQFIADRGTSANESSVRYVTAGTLGWTSGVLGGTSDYSLKNASRGLPDFFVKNSDGKIGIGTNLPLSDIHMIKANATLRVESPSGFRALINASSTSAGGDAIVESERYNSLTSSYFALRTALTGQPDWYIGQFASPVALNTALCFKIPDPSTGGDPFLSITKSGEIGIGPSGAVPNSVCHVRGGGALVGDTPNGGDLGAGTINTSLGVYTNGANGSHRGTRVVTADADATFGVTDSILIIDVTGFTANRTVTIDTDVFQDAFNTTGGRVVTIIRAGASAFSLSVAFEGSQTIYGGSGYVIPAATSDTILCTNPGGVSGQGEAYLLSRYTD